jgi:hypothetical protein
LIGYTRGAVTFKGRLFIRFCGIVYIITLKPITAVLLYPGIPFDLLYS